MITVKQNTVAGGPSRLRWRTRLRGTQLGVERRVGLGLLATTLASSVAIAAPVEASDRERVDVNRTTYVATGLDGHPELRGGRVLDITFGRTRGAIEFHSVSGAAPHTDYVVRAEVFFASECSADDPIGAVPVEEGTLSTNRAGAGLFSIHFPGEAFDTAPDKFWVHWLLVSDDRTAYESGCVDVELGG